jgi:hypothetical protein
MSSSVLFNAGKNLKHDERRRHLEDNGVTMNAPTQENKSFINNSVSMDRGNAKGKKKLIDHESEDPTQHNQNNLARLLFGSKNRSDALRKQRTSVDKTNLEQVLGNKKTLSRSEERKQKMPPTITVTSKNNANAEGLSGILRNKENLGTTRKGSALLIPVAKQSVGGGIVSIPRKAPAENGATNVRKNIIRTKIVNKVDDILNRELVDYF